MNKLSKKIKIFLKKKNKIIFLSTIIGLILIVVSFYFGAYTYHHKIFPFGGSKIIIEKVSYLKTAYNDIERKNYNTPSYSKYGAIDFLNDKLIYIQGDGQIFLFQENKNNFEFKKIESEKLPINRDEFIKKYEKVHGKTRLRNGFGIKDMMINKFDLFENTSIILSSLDYNIKNDCYKISLFLNEFIDVNKIRLNKWKKIFSSKNCLNLNMNPKKRFYLSASGGRIVKYDENNILLSIGSFDGDGHYSSLIHSQNLNNDYGKIIKVNLKDFSSEIFSYGHRNPQGLFLVDKDNIFSTEHGPKGGDELNLILKGRNYGWPIATFGTDYFKKFSDVDTTNNSHTGYEKPIFSWGNSWAVSELIVYESNYFDKWKDNIITSSLAAQTLTRMVFNKEKKSIIYFENIPIGKRIRDIIEAPSGEIVLLTDQHGGVDGYNDIPEIIFLRKKLN